MKNLLIIIIALLLSALLSAQNHATMRYGSTDASTLSAGDTVYVPVYLDYITPGAEVEGLDFVLSYDGNVLDWEFEYVIYLDSLQDWLFGYAGPGGVYGSWVEPTFLGATLDDVPILCEIILKYISTGGETQLTFDPSLTNGIFPGFEMTLIDGCVCSPLENPVTFHVTSGGNGLEGADVTVGDEIVSSNLSGNAVFYLLDGVYNYVISKVGFESQTGSFNVAGAVQTIECDLAQLLVLDLGNDTSMCMGDILLLDAGPGFDSYLWQDGTTTQTYLVNQAGEYWVQTWQGQTISTDTINIDYWPYPDPALGNDTTLCFGTSILLEPQSLFTYYTWQDSTNLPFYVVSQPGVYHVTVMDINGCIGSDTIWVDFANPVNLGPDTSITVSDSILLDAGDGFISYTWQDGSTSQYYLVNGDSLGSGIFEFSVSVVDSLGCISEDLIVVNILETSVFTILKDININIYPNPGNGIFWVKPEPCKANRINVLVLDLAGKVVYSCFFENKKEIFIDLSEQQKGMYFLQLRSGQMMWNEKLIIQ